MIRRIRPARAAVVGSLLAVLGLLALAPSCDDPQHPTPVEPGDGTYRGAYDSNGGVLEFTLRTPAGDLTALRLVATDLVYDDTAQELHARVALRNDAATPVSGAVAVHVGSFDPASVHPTNAPELLITCPRECPLRWVYDYRGTAGEDGVLSPGETSSPVEWILAAPPGESFSFLAAAVPHEPATNGVISGSVFADGNRNGQVDPGEPGIPGRLVRLVHAGGEESRTTDAAGRFAFQVGEPGVFEVACSPGGDCAPTTPLSRQVVIVRRPDGTLSGYDRADFGCGDRRLDVSVLGAVFEDLDRNGKRDPGEPGIPGVLVVGSVPQCPTFAPIEARTDERGRYAMSLPACEPPYVIHRAPLPGFVDTTPNPLVFPGPPVPGDSLPGSPPNPPPAALLLADFGVAREGTGPELFIEGFVYHDLDRNGQRDAGEPGLPDLGVWASGLLCMTPVSAYTRTDAAGHYRLAGRDVHCPLPWLAGSEAPPGWCATRITLDGPPPDGSDTFRVDFGVAPCDSIPPLQGFHVTGVVFLDSDRDGLRDPDEPGLQGVVLELMTQCDAIFRTTTDAAGQYSFRTGGCGAYAVAVVEPGFPVYTTPNPAPFDPGTPPGTVVTIDFGVQRIRPPG